MIQESVVIVPAFFVEGFGDEVHRVVSCRILAILYRSRTFLVKHSISSSLTSSRLTPSSSKRARRSSSRDRSVRYAHSVCSSNVLSMLIWMVEQAGRLSNAILVADFLGLALACISKSLGIPSFRVAVKCLHPNQEICP